jgi:hypothetical protein
MLITSQQRADVYAWWHRKDEQWSGRGLFQDAIVLEWQCVLQRRPQPQTVSVVPVCGFRQWFLGKVSFETGTNVEIVETGTWFKLCVGSIIQFWLVIWFISSFDDAVVLGFNAMWISSEITSALKMEAVCFSETLVSTQESIRRHNPKEQHRIFTAVRS